MELSLQPGSIINFKGQQYRVTRSLSLERVLIEPIDAGEAISASISELYPTEICSNFKPNEPIGGTIDSSKYSEQEWAQTKKREELIQPYSSLVCSRMKAKEIANKLEISERYVYKLIKQYHNSGNKFDSLLPTKRKGSTGKTRINKEVEKIVDATIDEFYLTKQKLKISIVIQETKRRCSYNNLKAPSKNTIWRRIIRKQGQNTVKKREGSKIANEIYSPIVGATPIATQPLSILQIDHTLVDLIIVDEFHRKPIGRPYLTLAIDVFSRCITGFCLTLEAPSAVSVGLCLTHSIFDKEAWLDDRKIKTSWPIWGKPKIIYVDNASEFHSEALQRGCDLHGIRIEYRPLGQPHFGGIIERVIGTMMQLIHQLPGTTFSNIVERGEYPSEEKATLTLSELEHWLTIAITDYYHQKVHQGIHLPPIEKYKIGILGDEHYKGCGYFPRIHNKKAFLIDFLPIQRRTLQRHGFMLDHITYFSPAISPLIANRNRHGKFMIRRDPRDISKIYILDHESQAYLEIPYRTISRPSVTLWEHQQAIKSLHEKGIEKTDENLIFKAIEKLRKITEEASKNTKAARRRFERAQKALIDTALNNEQPYQDDQYERLENRTVAQPFEDIEIW